MTTISGAEKRLFESVLPMEYNVSHSDANALTPPEGRVYERH